MKRFGQERYEFYYSETGTHQILDNVKNRVCDLGIIYLSDENETVIRKVLEEYRIVFTELFEAKPHVFFINYIFQEVMKKIFRIMTGFTKKMDLHLEQTK